MPIYEYRCQACGHQLEALQKISEDPLTDCPECTDGELKRLMSATAFRLSGSGWYETDFKKSNQRNLASDGKDGGKADKGEKKPAAKSDKPAGNGKAASH